ncbi:F-box protein At2g27310-like [Bidens hawaiensis]|uniref:F-box protein At2g27310-like n=1 Tax=Bidens hawaiensis TaxID=980011 RepID=UPI00404B344E
MPTSLSDIHPDIIQTHILPRQDARSLSTLATVSSYLNTLCSDHSLWSHISKATWPSITHPLVDDIISTFPGGHKSLFQDSFPSLTTTVNRHHSRYNKINITHPLPSQLISAVDIRYQTDIIYSTVQFTDITTDFLSSELLIKLKADETSNNNNRYIDMKVDEFAGVEEEKLPHLKDSVTLNWIIIDPTLKRTGNLSTIKPVAVKKDWTTNETLVQYVTVLPGCDPGEMVKCRIQVVLGVGHKVGLKVKEVTLMASNLGSCCLKGREFLVILRRAIIEENNIVTRVAAGEKEGRKRRLEFKEVKRQRRELLRMEEDKRDSDIVKKSIGLLVSFCFSVYFFSLMMLQ